MLLHVGDDKLLRLLLLDRRFLIFLLIVNLAGTIYGYIWYEPQLADTPAVFLPFVPDSPTASLFFTIFLLFLLIGKKVPYIEALAAMSMFKYGIWAVVMNVLLLSSGYELNWQGYMLIASHGAMAVEALLYAPFYQLKLRHLGVASVWLLHNEIIDYVYGMMPVYGPLEPHMKEIGYFTFWLSIFSIFIIYRLTIGKKESF